MEKVNGKWVNSNGKLSKYETRVGLAPKARKMWCFECGRVIGKEELAKGGCGVGHEGKTLCAICLLADEVKHPAAKRRWELGYELLVLRDEKGRSCVWPRVKEEL